MRIAPFAAAVLVCMSVPALAQTPDTSAPPAARAPESSSPAPNAPEATPPSPAPIKPTEAAPQSAPSLAPAPTKPAEAAPPPAPPPTKPAEAAPPLPPSRFSFSRVEIGFLRLDRQTGQVALCSAHTVGWACEAVPEDRAALEKEIARLQDEVTSLKQELAELQPPPPRPPAPVPDTSGKRLPVPSTEDIARARAYVEEAWRRLVEMLMNFQKDVMRKT